MPSGPPMVTKSEVPSFLLRSRSAVASCTDTRTLPCSGNLSVRWTMTASGGGSGASSRTAASEAALAITVATPGGVRPGPALAVSTASPSTTARAAAILTPRRLPSSLSLLMSPPFDAPFPFAATAAADPERALDCGTKDRESPARTPLSLAPAEPALSRACEDLLLSRPVLFLLLP